MVFKKVVRRVWNAASLHKQAHEQPTQIELLISRGLSVGKNFNILNGVVIDPDHCWHIVIGDDVTLAPFVHILAHDASTKMFLDFTRIGKVAIGNQVFIGARAIVMPGVTIGSKVIIGAGAVVTKSIPDSAVAVGNPARVVCGLEEFLDKRKSEMLSVPSFGEEYTLRQNVSVEMKEEMNLMMSDRIGYID